MMVNAKGVFVVTLLSTSISTAALRFLPAALVALGGDTVGRSLAAFERLRRCFFLVTYIFA